MKHDHSDATCTTPATCICGDTIGEKNPNNHVHTEIRGAKAATCAEAGYTGDTYCKDCGVKISSGTAIPATNNHNFTGELVQKDTGTGGPGHAYKCVNAGCTESGRAEPCTFGEWTTTKAATCEEKGIKTRTCTVCGRAQTEDIDATGHKDGDGDGKCDNCETDLTCVHTYEVQSFTAETCESGSVTVEKCSKCGHTRSVVGKVPGHAWNDGEVTKAATCTEKGKMTFKCTREGCEATKTEEIKLIGHPYENIAQVNPTCTEPGTEAHMRCTACGQLAQGTMTVTAADLVIPALNHSWGAWALNADQTKLVRTCVRGCEESVDLPSLPEESGNNGQWSYDVTPATCAAEGSVVFTYTYTENGAETTTTATVTLPVDLTNHVGETEVRGAVAATATTPGYTGDTYCTSCNTLLATGTGIPATGTGGEDIEPPDVPLVDGTEIDEPEVPLAGLMTRAEFVNYLYVQAGSPEAQAPTFTDVPEDHEYAAAIGWAQANGIAKGITEDEFAPDEIVSVEQATLFLVRYAQFSGVEMPELAALAGKDPLEILDNADEVLAEFFEAILPKPQAA